MEMSRVQTLRICGCAKQSHVAVVAFNKNMEKAGPSQNPWQPPTNKQKVEARFDDIRERQLTQMGATS